MQEKSTSYLGALSEKELSNFNPLSNWREYYTQGGRLVPITHDIEYHYVLFTHPIKINSADVSAKVKFSNCLFSKDCVVYGAFQHSLTFDGCMFDGSLEIIEPKFESDFHLINVKAKGQILVQSGTFNTCHWSVQDKTRVTISAGDFKNLHIGYWGDADAGNVSISCDKVTGKIQLSRSIDVLLIHGTASDLSVSVTDATIRKLSIYRFRNEKGFRIVNLSATGNIDTEVSFTESYFGKSEFYDIDFSRFKEMNIRDSHLVETTFVHVDWPEEIKATFGTLAGNIELTKTINDKLAVLKSALNWKQKKQIRRSNEIVSYYTKQREIYRQLKYALSKQGDSIGEQAFHAKELIAHRHTLLGTRIGLGTRLIILLSSWTSDFGQSIKRPLLSLLGGHFLLLAILIGTGFYGQQMRFSFCPNWRGFELGIHEFFRLINPLRRDFGEFKGYYILVDVAMRIWGSYMLYNFVRASRRFIK